MASPLDLVPTKGEYVDRKRTLPRRVVPVSLHITRLPTGRHVVVIEVLPDGTMRFEAAQLSIDKSAKL